MVDHVQIAAITPRIRYVADGLTTTFDFGFAIFKAENLKVYLNETLLSSTAYVVEGEGLSDGGTVVFEEAPEAGTIITLKRDLSIERTTDFQEGSSLRASVLNDELDYQTACLQQVADNVNRSMVLPEYATDLDVNLTLPKPVAGKAIVWDSSGKKLENSTVEVNALESTLLGYKQSAEACAATATEKAATVTQQAASVAAAASEVTNTLSNCLDKNVSNLTAVGKEAITYLCQPSARSIDLTLPESGHIFTAPANGYYMISTTSDNVNGYGYSFVSLKNNMTNVYQCLMTSMGIFAVPIVPVRKGDTVTLSYNGTLTVDMLKFIYAEGN